MGGGTQTKTYEICKRIHKDGGVTQIRAALVTTSSNIKGVSVITARDNVSVSMDEVRKLRERGRLHNTLEFGARVAANLCFMCTHANV